MSKDTGWEKEATDAQDGVYDCTMRWTQTTKTNEDSGHGQHWAQDAGCGTAGSYPLKGQSGACALR